MTKQNWDTRLQFSAGLYVPLATHRNPRARGIVKANPGQGRSAAPGNITNHWHPEAPAPSIYLAGVDTSATKSLCGTHLRTSDTSISLNTPNTSRRYAVPQGSGEPYRAGQSSIGDFICRVSNSGRNLALRGQAERKFPGEGPARRDLEHATAFGVLKSGIWHLASRPPHTPARDLQNARPHYKKSQRLLVPGRQEAVAEGGTSLGSPSGSYAAVLPGSQATS
ncbi:hypothetical protein CGRA01v4_09240 [Colletotrichum graminicola]|uniref:Uncharacterized protein n=1 Tax=Colletotrichum graminicola (strain M1.001 / M2 / FGSC 10212) TaxID=645133 RepID=E3Q6T2_COLGM|nr:uncharacterized protein GLRG_02390 [Colletotrichum graminicola M1.001]EFQ26570.1 hypothetical protein GLRG_02390 [Colletotrichum graminicola M1.001]WDK17954.1 hypothetical protein CGRA01v4_09240 [Colletotrichum graminicola]